MAVVRAEQEVIARVGECDFHHCNKVILSVDGRRKSPTVGRIQCIIERV